MLLVVQEPAPAVVAPVDAPLLEELAQINGERGAGWVVQEELGHVEADAAGADDGHALAHLFVGCCRCCVVGRAG